jgi:hypothetical protein
MKIKKIYSLNKNDIYRFLEALIYALKYILIIICKKIYLLIKNDYNLEIS